MKHVKEETKLKQKRCQGEGLEYIPWILARETSSIGSSFITYNYKTGRSVNLLSEAEAKVFFLLLWADEVSDIKEQYVLDLDETQKIAEDLGFRKPAKRMSTDFFFKMKDPVYNFGAISVKASRSQLKNERTRQLLKIEESYWNNKGVNYELVFADDINPIVTNNIRNITRITEPEDIEDDVMALKWLLTHKKIPIDLTKDIDYLQLLNKHQKEVDRLYEVLRCSEKRNWKRRRKI